MSNDTIYLPAFHIPSYRTQKALERGVEKNLLLRTWGGLGDQICAEPTLRFALRTFKGCDISLASEHPELFQHLKFKRVFDLKEEKPVEDKYFIFDTITDTSNLVWEFFSHMLVNCVDFPSLCAFRTMLPVEDKELLITGKRPDIDGMDLQDLIEKSVFIHAGRHWASKTFPKEWWDQVIRTCLDMDALPVLIGADTDDNRGTVDVDKAGCLDLRNRLSIQETVWLLQRAKSLLTNDSAPLHMACSSDPLEPAITGHCSVHFVATCKHPDMISHWRKGEWSFGMHNHGKGGIWNEVDFCPNKEQELTAEFVPQDMLESWLPNPVEFAAAGVTGVV